MTPSVDDLRAFISTLERREHVHGEGETWSWTTVTHHAVDGPWWYHATPGYSDFNRELCPPGVLDGLPDGGVGVRSDDDFWTEAILPWEFRSLTIQEIATVLWPNVEDPTFGPDTTAGQRNLQ